MELNNIYNKYIRLHGHDRVNFIFSYLQNGMNDIYTDIDIPTPKNMKSDDVQLVDLIFDNHVIVILSNSSPAIKVLRNRLLIDGVMLMKLKDKKLERLYKQKYKGNNKYCVVYQNLGQTQAICDN